MRSPQWLHDGFLQAVKILDTPRPRAPRASEGGVSAIFQWLHIVKTFDVSFRLLAQELLSPLGRAAYE